MKPTLRWVCIVVRRCKLSKLHVFESLPKPLKVSGNVENRKLFILYFRKNESESSDANWQNWTFWKVHQKRWNFQGIMCVESYLFYKSKKLSATLLRVYRAIGRSKLTERNFFESQPKPILIPEIIKNSKFLILCIRKNKSNSYMGL